MTGLLALCLFVVAVSAPAGTGPLFALLSIVFFVFFLIDK